MSKLKRGSFFIFLLFISNIISWLIIYEINLPKNMEVVFFDVGQGDAILIKTPENHKIIIDGGITPKILEKLSQEIPFWDRDIDLLILTHAHKDHLNGLIDVLEYYDVGLILWNGLTDENTEKIDSFNKWKEKIEDKDVFIARAGQRISGRSFYIDILHPFILDNYDALDLNETSVIAKLYFKSNSFLFTGDATIKNEKELIDAETSCYKKNNPEYICKVMNLKSTVLKVGHHGSKTSTSRIFLEKVYPKIAVISVGSENSYGHPHQETLESLQKYDIKVFRTDEQGDIKIVSF